MKTIFHICFVLIALLLSRIALSQDCPDSCEFYMPNVLSPDTSDEGGEILKITSNCDFNSFQFTLYNRWGMIIFESTDPKMAFESTGNQDGIYIWKLKGEMCNGLNIDEQGQITIIH